MIGIAPLFLTAASANDWPQWRGGPLADGAWREDGIVTNFPAPGPVVKWRAPIGPGYSGPSVANGFVYVMDRQNADPSNSCERVVCLDANTGTIRWQHAYACKYVGVGYDSGPRVTPAIADGKAYALGTMGDLVCLNAADGKLLWGKNFPRDYQATVPTWGFSAQLLVDLTGASDHLPIVADFTIPLPPPVITNFSLAGTNLIFTLANSITGGVFTVLTSANLSLPRTNWTALATNVANSATFRFTNGLNPAAPAQFYLFQEK